MPTVRVGLVAEPLGPVTVNQCDPTGKFPWMVIWVSESTVQVMFMGRHVTEVTPVKLLPVRVTVKFPGPFGRD